MSLSNLKVLITMRASLWLALFSFANTLVGQGYEASSHLAELWRHDSSTMAYDSILKRLMNEVYHVSAEERASYYVRGIAILEKAPKSKDSIVARAAVYQGMDLARNNKYTESIKSFKKALALYQPIFPKSHYYLHSTYFHLAEKSLNNNDFESARIFCDSAIACQWGQPLGRNWPRCMLLMTRIQAHLGNAAKADLYSMMTQHYAQRYTREGDIYYANSLGACYLELEMPEKTLELCLPLADRTKNPTYLYNRIGRAYFQQEKYEDAMRYYQLIHGLDPENLTNLDNISHCYSHMGKADLALQYLNRIDTTSLSEVALLTHKINLAQTYADAGLYNKAQALDKELEVEIESMDDLAPLVSARYYTNRIEHIFQASSNFFDERTNQENIDFIKRAHHILNDQRVQLSSSTARQNYSKVCYRFYDNAIKYLAMPMVVVEGKDSLVFKFMETTRALTLMEEFLIRAKNRREKLTYRNKYDQCLKNIEESESLDHKLRWCDTLFFWLENEGTDSNIFKPPEPVAALTVNPNQLLCEYFIHGDTSLSIYIKSDGQAEIHRLEKTEWFSDITSFINWSRESPSGRTLQKSNDDLFEILFPGVDLSGFEEVLIVPDGVLSFFPFAALSLAERYFGVTHALSYSFSYSMLQESRALVIENRKALVFAPSFGESPSLSRSVLSDGTVKKFGALKHSRIEAERIKDLLKGEAKIYFDGQASKAQFQETASQARVLHLATHAFASYEGDYEPEILFQGDTGIESVQRDDLYLARIPTEMVVISACQTAVGNYSRGEGIMSFARAFTAAGAKSVLASLWAVNDVTTAYLMESFYKHLYRGERKDKALQLAQRDYLEYVDPQYRHPYYWAGFVAVGDMSEVRFGNKWGVVLISLFGIILGLVAWILITKRGTTG